MTHKSKILVVDNEPAMVQLLQMTLGTHGYDVDTATTGEEALALAHRDTDLVLMDLALPDRNGFELCHLLKTGEETRHIPVIIVSQRHQNGDKIASFHLGADDFIPIPFEPEELFARVDAVLRRYHPHTEEVQRETSYAIISELRHIIDEELVTPYFQPIYLLNPVRLMGVEVLSRPQTKGVLSNPEFLFKSAVRYGFYYDLEMIVWRKALDIAERILDKEKLFLNCSPYLIENNRFHEVKEVFSRIDLSSRRVFLEITERSAMGESQLFYDLLAQYRDHGFNIAIDDVGAGYASLESIIQTKPEAVKIDRHLVNGLSSDPFRRSIVKLIVAFCHEHGIICIAEGIETKADLETLSKLGVPAGQGYYLYRPSGQVDLKAMRGICV